MTIEQMREALYTLYPGDSWYERVNKMPDKQVYSIYMRVLSSGEIKKGSL